jgi:Gluconate 2-dehydrogenase subunit 3
MWRVNTVPGQIDTHRRAFMRSSAIGLFAYTLAGCDVLLSPKDARERGADHTSFSSEQMRSLDALGEALLPGAVAAGFSHYIDANLAREPGESLLMVRYLDIVMPHRDFYANGLAALNGACRKALGKPFVDLKEAEATPVLAGLLKGNPPGWDDVANAPPAPLFYLAVRGDAVDIVYGTMAGFEALDIPYLGHIDPKTAY